MNETPPANESPRWGSTTKLVVGLTMIAVIAALLIQFRTIIGPIILAVMLTYLLHPVTAWLTTHTRLRWRPAVNLIFLAVVILYLGSFTVTGLTVVQQLQYLVDFVRTQVTDLPELAASLSTQEYRFGPFVFNLAQFDLQALSEQLISAVQPLLGRLGALISTLATGAAGLVGWSFFVILISYFLLADADRFSDELVHIEIPGYSQDVRHLGQELRRIWNAYLRGQLIIILLVIVMYLVLMGILGVRFAIGIAILSGVARFVPYVGPTITWTVTFLVALFQGGNYFGLESYQYAILVVVLSVVLDQIFDNMISPRLLGATLGVHPAGVLIAAIVAANLIGFIGLVLAAPVLATLRLLARYVGRKMFDLDPWAPSSYEPQPEEIELPLVKWRRRLRAVGRFLRRQGS